MDDIYDPFLDGKQYKMSTYVWVQFLQDVHIQRQVENKQSTKELDSGSGTADALALEIIQWGTQWVFPVGGSHFCTYLQPPILRNFLTGYPQAVWPDRELELSFGSR